MRHAFITAGRILRQLRGDPRTIALMLLVPLVLMGLMAWIYHDQKMVFDRIGPSLLGIFPLTVMFIVTSITTLRERQTGTLERLLTTPQSKGAFMAGYAIAFGAVALLQAVVASAWSVWVCGLDLVGHVWQLVIIAVADAVLGTSLGLLASGFARTEFQAVQFMPAFIFPQFFLCGLLLPRDQLPDGLRQLSDVLPLSYAVDAMKTVATRTDGGADLAKDVAILVGFSVVALCLGALTLRRRTD